MRRNSSEFYILCVSLVRHRNGNHLDTKGMRKRSPTIL